MEIKKGKNIGNYVKLAIATLMVIISTADTGKELRKAIDEFKH